MGLGIVRFVVSFFFFIYTATYVSDAFYGIFYANSSNGDLVRGDLIKAKDLTRTMFLETFILYIVLMIVSMKECYCFLKENKPLFIYFVELIELSATVPLVPLFFCFFGADGIDSVAFAVGSFGS